MNAVVDVVVPVFGIVVLGAGLARAGIFNAATSDGLTRFMFYVAVPAMLFRTLATTELPATVPWAYILAFYGPSFVVFFSGIVLSRIGFDWSRRDQGIGAITASYSNMVMLGFPIVITAFGDAGALPLFIILALQSTLMFPATAWMIEIYGRDADTGHPSFLISVGKMFLNPVILSLGLGVAANLMSVGIGGAVARILEIIGAAAPACALIALGVGLAQYELRGDLRKSLTLVVLKGLLHPALVWSGCWALDIPVLWTHVAVLLAAMPTGINAFILARNYEIRVSVVSKTIVLGTLLSMLTVSLLLQLFLA
jgi:malonate transporter and related proteins